MSYRISRERYSHLYGPTTGDRVRLADTDLFALVEADLHVLGDEASFGGGKSIRDGMAQTASPAEALDLVITVDTSMGHLTGALGKPVWIMIPKAADWRWLLGRDTSPWYPSLRLYRQPKLDDWASVIERIATDLAA